MISTVCLGTGTSCGTGFEAHTSGTAAPKDGSGCAQPREVQKEGASTTPAAAAEPQGNRKAPSGARSLLGPGWSAASPSSLAPLTWD